VANVCKLALVWVIESSGDEPPGTLHGVMTFHVMRPDSGDPFSIADQDDLIARVWSWWHDDTVPGITGDPARKWWGDFVYVQRIEAQAVEPTLEDRRDWVPDDESLKYGSGGPPGEPQLCALLGLRTSVEDRTTRGRMYFPWAGNPLGAGRSLGYIIEPTRDRIAQMGQNLAVCIRGDDFETDPKVLCVYSRVAGDAHAVTHFVVGDRVTTQRRRASQSVTHYPYDLVAP